MKVSRVAQSRTIRLIASANHKPPVLQGLVSSFGAIADLEELESATSGRLDMEQKGIPGVAADGLASGYGYTFVNAAFAYPRPKGSRFNTERWGAWYCGFELQTAISEVGFHLRRAIEAAGGAFDNTTHYVELLADFDAEFVDLRKVDPKPECLRPDFEAGYAAGQSLASTVREQGGNGIVYPSVRCDGTCLVAFWPGLIQNFQRGDTWIFEWAGSPDPTIRKA